MNWWIVFQLGQWLVATSTPPKLYLLDDEAFFAQPAIHQLIRVDDPDTLLLDAALFQATNQVRRAAGLAIFHYDRGLYQASRDHAQSMIQNDFYSHQDLHQLADMTPEKRVRKQTKRFNWVAENIGQYQTINTAYWYGVRFDRQRQRYEYIDIETRQLYRPYSYAAYAQYAVQQWLNSPHHRANLLSPVFTHVGCSGRFSPHPFEQRRPPFGRLVQDFGAQ